MEVDAEGKEPNERGKASTYLRIDGDGRQSGRKPT